MNHLFNHRAFPPIARMHPMFFVILFAVAMHHLLYGLFLLLDADHRFPDGPTRSFFEVMNLLDPEIWAIPHLVAWVLITIGVYTKWRIVQLGLAIGLFKSVMWVWLLEIGPAAGGGLAVWLVVIASHFVQMLEPPRNPLTERT